MFLVPGSLAVARRQDGSQIHVVLSVLCLAMLLVAVYVVIALRRGKVSDLDVSQREQRPKMYIVAILSCAIGCLVLFLLGQPAATVRGALCALGLLVASAAANQVGFKASLHTSFAVYAAGLLAIQGLVSAILGLVLAAGIAWSRVALKRHTPKEVVLGYALGSFAFLGMHFW